MNSPGMRFWDEMSRSPASRSVRCTGGGGGGAGGGGASGKSSLVGGSCELEPGPRQSGSVQFGSGFELWAVVLIAHLDGSVSLGAAWCRLLCGVAKMPLSV